MDSLYLVLGLLAVASFAGLVFRATRGRGRELSGAELVDLERLPTEKNGVPTKVLGRRATLIQFSTKYCGQCPGVRRQLAQLEYRHGGVSFLEVDVTDRMDIAAHFKISQTPTVLVLNSNSQIVYRVGGVPHMNEITEELAKLGVA